MSRGFGTGQRLMLSRLADHEVRVAEAAAQRQRPYRPPDLWSLNTLTYSTYYKQIIAAQRAHHEWWQDMLRGWRAGNATATEWIERTVSLRYAFGRDTVPLKVDDPVVRSMVPLPILFDYLNPKEWNPGKHAHAPSDN